jgi:hypothetical protein
LDDASLSITISGQITHNNLNIKRFVQLLGSNHSV